MKVLAVLEQRDGALRKVSHEVLAAARNLADTSGGTVDAVVLGAGAVTGMDQLGGFGADQVLHGTHADFVLALLQRLLTRPVPAHFGRGRVDAQVFERQLEARAVVERDFEQTGASAGCDGGWVRHREVSG